MRSGGSCRSGECSSDTERVKPAICEQFGIDFPLFAFSHCCDVVAAVTNAGGFGVLGGTAFTPEQLDQELSWIDDQVGDKPYGLDLIVPAKFEGKGEKVTSSDLAARIPDEVRGYVAELLAAHDIESDPKPFIGGSSLAGTTGRELLEAAMSHPIKLIANALGVPPDYMIDAGKERGIPVAASSASRNTRPNRLLRRGSHCGARHRSGRPLRRGHHDGACPRSHRGHRRRGSRAGRGRHRDGQADGRRRRDGGRRRVDGIGLADHGGGRDGSAYQAEVPRGDVTGHHSPTGRTGKPAWQLVSEWTDAWAPTPGGHQTLPLPLQSMLCEPVIRRVDVLASQGHPGAQALATYFVGQGVGLMNKVKPAREVVREFIEDYLAATERLSNSLPD